MTSIKNAPAAAATTTDAQVHKINSDSTLTGAKRQAPAFLKMFADIDNTDPGRYRIQFDEACAIVERASNNPFATARLAFQYGFIKGQRAEKARQKTLRKRKKVRA